MTLVPHARRVLADVEIVRDRLEHEKGWVEWRLSWITAVVLVRVVGHVLHKVDGDAEPAVRAVADEMHRSWKGRSEEHAIFRDFVEQERNSILKEYETQMSEGPIPVVARAVDPASGQTVEIGALIEENVYRPMTGGPYEGEDGRTLLDMAIAWWKAQLDQVDVEAMRRRASSPDRPGARPRRP